jgi:cytoskeletal protein RodZ
MSLGKDLASLRQSQNLSLEDIQNAIKIPINILKSIEDESIFSDPSKNKTYVRSFVRSYAKALKIEDKEIVRALDEQEKGQYSGGLVSEDEPIQEYEPPISSENTFFSEADDDTNNTESPSDEIIAESSSEKIQPKTPSGPQSQPPSPDEKSDIKNINWADIGNSFSIDGKRSRTWVIFTVVVLIIAVLAAMYFYRDTIKNMFISSPDENEQVVESMPLSQDNMTISADTSEAQENITSESISPDEESAMNEERNTANLSALGETLSVVVYAAYSQLDPVRVTSDFNDRTNPFWMEQGEAYYFDFQDSLLIRGQYGDLLLMFNGHVIENPRQNHFDDSLNSIVITRDILSQSKYREPAPEEFPLNIAPPDSIVYRVRF